MSQVAATRATFRGGGGLFRDLHEKVDAYRKQAGVTEQAYKRLHRKAVFIIAWAVVSYVALLTYGHSVWSVVVFGLSFVLALDAFAFNVSHDGNHGAFSRSSRLNTAAGFGLEMLGGSSLIWKKKHNDAHHNNPNVVGEDDDIDAPPLARFASSQEYKPWYRFQHLYAWILYGFMAIRWQFWGDYESLVRGRIGSYPLKLTTRDVVVFLFGKVFFYSWALVLPLYLLGPRHGVLMVLAVIFGAELLLSFILTLTFQMAHCVDEALFTSPDAADENGKMPNTWAEHQLLTTSDFCPRNRLVTWFMGGLNYQIEHHLFPRLPHTLYPQIAPIVRQVAERHGVKYNCQRTLCGAIAAHARHLWNMGRPPAEVGM